MTIRRSVGKLLIYAVLEFGAICGVPMRPDQIEQLMKLNDQPKQAHVIKRDDDEPLRRKRPRR